MRRKSIVAALAALCFAFGLSPSAFAADIINGCVQANGTLRIVDSPSACRVGESPIQLASPSAIPKLIHGTVKFDGTIISGTGFSVQDHNPNVDDPLYTIVFTTPFTSTPNCFFHTVGTETLFLEVLTVSSNSQQVKIKTGIVHPRDQFTDPQLNVFFGAASFEFVCVQ
jgi:type 1 fimbria pilin